MRKDRLYWRIVLSKRRHLSGSEDNTMKGWPGFFLICLLILFTGTLVAEELPQRPSVLWQEAASDPADPQLEGLSKAFVRLAEKVRPAVVQIRVNTKAAPAGDDESQRPSNSRGSGFIIEPQGYVLTAHHVIEAAREIEVRLADRRRLRAKLVASDPQVDFAILKIDTDKELPALAIGDSDHLKVGELVGSLGYPFGTDSSLSLGILSRQGRSQTNSAAFDFLQTNAGASPGGSGGPLVDLRGHVVGMITMASQGGNMGFAVPINAIKRVLPRLLRGEKIVWGWIGVKVSEVTLDLAETLGLSPAKGVLVSSVLQDQPAERGGLRPQDVILSIDGIEVDSPREVTRMIAGTEAGKEVRLTVFRKGQTLDLSVRLGSRPKATEGREG
jgi:S1-C subfamily serine protease